MGTALREARGAEFNITRDEILAIGRVLHARIAWLKRISEAMVAVESLADQVHTSGTFTKDEQDFLAHEKLRANHEIDNTEARFVITASRLGALETIMKHIGLEYVHPGKELLGIIESDQLKDEELHKDNVSVTDDIYNISVGLAGPDMCRFHDLFCEEEWNMDCGAEPDEDEEEMWSRVEKRRNERESQVN